MKEILSRYGFSALLLIIGVALLVTAITGGQNTYVVTGLAAVIACALLISLHNANLLPLKLTLIITLIVIIGAGAFAYMDYSSVRRKLEFFAEQQRREAKVVKRLIDIRSAEMSYKKLYGTFTANFDELIRHVKYDSMPIVKAVGFVPDTITEIRAVELGIVTRDTILISVRDTLFPKNFHVDSIQYVPFSGGQQFELQAGEVEKNNLMIKVFEAFANYSKILHGMNLSEDYIDTSEGLRVGSMTEPHTRGNWE